jgi:tagatose-1,6-bisphosphate aldolase
MTLRIQRSTKRQSVVFTLSGRIQGDQISELEALLQSESSDCDIVLEMRDVKLVDRDAVRFLVHWEAQGAELRNCSAYIREWISLERKWM